MERAIDTDVRVVGAGIVGLAHAREARRRGLEVVVLERGERAVGASVRNFGHGFISAMADGPALECALQARERWIELGRRAGFEVLESGTVIVARHPDEVEVMAQATRDPRRAARLVEPEVARLAAIPTEVVAGIGMTTALGLAPRVIDEMLAGAASDGLSAAPAVAFGGARPRHEEARADYES
ncbi:MAG TPA: FAD-dependent oxidoreductase [Solirubrobacteraceae bacterium]|nr:FAD-dependent oxidoreductase [Solirubrobacteraceae bacterium]